MERRGRSMTKVCARGNRPYLRPGFHKRKPHFFIWPSARKEKDIEREALGVIGREGA